MNSERTILKQTGISRAVPIAVWVACALASADAVIEGTASFALHTIAALAAVALATWIVLFSPHFAVDAEGVTIVNPTRTTRVPFGALVDVRISLVVSAYARFAGGRERKITAWNAPGLKRRRPARQFGGFSGGGATGMLTYAENPPGTPGSAEPRPNPTATSAEVAVVVDRFRAPWDAQHPGGDSAAVATMSWRWREWLVLTVLILVNVAIRLR
jgi:hypothetical protein